MALIVGVHGIGQQVKGEAVLHREWFAPMVDGVRFAGRDPADEDPFLCSLWPPLPPRPAALGR